MSLDKFVDEVRLDLDALARIKKRVFVVGRFNMADQGDEPNIFLFTGQGRNDEYLKNFTDCDDMSYESFGRHLKPAIAERVEKDGRFPAVIQEIPRGEADQESAAVIDVFNYFFQRAVANSDQKEFIDEMPGLNRHLLQTKESDRGKAILTQIRKYLATFCEFQPKTHLIVEGAAKLLGSVAGRELPAFAQGGALPGGFPEKLIDYVYAEDTREPFKPDGLTFRGTPWEALVDDEEKRGIFVEVITAYREALLSAKNRQYKRPFKAKPLNKWADKSVSPSLRKSFEESRDAFNGLRQILRSKVLLSMVLEWLLNSYYELDSVREVKEKLPENVDAHDRAVEDAILRGWKENKLKKPYKRPSFDERRRFSNVLTESFEGLLKAIVAEEKEYKKLKGALPQELQELAESARADKDKLALLQAVSAARLEPDLHTAFIDASKTVLLDVLCPVLYRPTVLTESDLRRYFKRESMAAFLTAIFLSESSQDAVRKIAEDHIDYFEEQIDENKIIKNTDQILKRLLDGFLDVLASEEVQRRLGEGIAVLREVHALYEASQIEAAVGAGGVSAIYHHEPKEAKKFGSLEATQEPVQAVKEMVPAVVRDRLALKLGAAGGASARQAPRGGSAQGGEEGKEGAAATTEESTGAPEEPTRLQREIDEILERTVVEVPDEVTEAQKEEWEEKAAAEILQNEAFVGGLARDVRAFERTLHLIYSRYSETRGDNLKTFHNKVERMTLVNLMLLFKGDLGLGKMCSNLYELLLDLVVELDSDDPDPRDFMFNRSLTYYFDDALLENGGITALREILEIQSSDSLQNIVSFVSELRGLAYLMKKVSADPDTEVIIVNATADEFLKWVVADNLVANKGRGRLRSNRLVQGHSNRCILPGLIYMTDIAFPEDGKLGWIQSLSNAKLQEDKLGVILPPICVSAPAQGEQAYEEVGQQLAEAAAQAAAPVVVVGPSCRLNREDDGFPTVLPAGYMFAAHFLARPNQRLVNENVAHASSGRFRVIGYGATPMKDSLEAAVWGADSDVQSFAVDFYLFLVLSLAAAAQTKGGTTRFDADSFYKCFVWNEQVMDPADWHSSQLLDKSVLGGKALRFSLEENPAGSSLESVLLREKAKAPAGRKILDVTWFNLARDLAQLK